MRKNILYFEPSSGFGGSASSLANIIKQLDKERFWPIVVIKNYGSQFKKIENTEIIKLRDYKEPQELSIFGFFIYFIS